MNLLCMVNSDGSVGGQPLVLRTEELACRARDAGDTNATARREDLLQEETATHSHSVFVPGESHGQRKSTGGLQFTGLPRVGDD